MNAYQTVFCYILNTIMLLKFDNIFLVLFC